MARCDGERHPPHVWHSRLVRRTSPSKVRSGSASTRLHVTWILRAIPVSRPELPWTARRQYKNMQVFAYTNTLSEVEHHVADFARI
jgi:hypothetical protein